VSGAKAKIKRQAKALLEWFAREARDLPWRRTRDPYAIWVSEIMLQQTQVKTVIPYWERWMKALPDVQTLAEARPDRLHKLWEGLGYYTRVRNLQKAAQLIVGRHGGRFPNEFEQVLDLPGIGRYTAGAICSIAFNQPRSILDGNVIRVLTRVHGLAGDPKAKALNQRLWQLAEDWVLSASGRHGTLNESLMELGALVCLPRDPRCEDCPVRKTCVARRDDRIAELPGIPRRQPSTPRWFAALVMRRGERFLVVQRPHGVVNGSFWEFPNVELKGPGADSLRASLESSSRRKEALTSDRRGSRKPGHLSPLTSAATTDSRVFKQARETAMASLGVRFDALKLLCTIKHSITRYRITLKAFVADAVVWKKRTGEQGRWLTLAEMEKLAFTSAHRKILRMLRR